MKAIFITYDQAYNEEIIELLEAYGQRGFTRWNDVSGRGMEDGDPHYGSHAWPIMNHAVLTMVEDSLAPQLLEALHLKDEEFKDLGLRAFCWNVESFV